VPLVMRVTVTARAVRSVAAPVVGARMEGHVVMATQMLSKSPTSERSASSDFRRQLEGYGLTTAQIFYRLPDHPSLLQTYVWQEYDLFPKFPALNRFLAFWLEKLEGPLHSVTVAHSRLIRPAEIRAVNGEFRLH
jgi:uncharacterized protein Usg